MLGAAGRSRQRGERPRLPCRTLATSLEHGLVKRRENGRSRDMSDPWVTTADDLKNYEQQRICAFSMGWTPHRPWRDALRMSRFQQVSTRFAVVMFAPQRALPARRRRRLAPTLTMRLQPNRRLEVSPRCWHHGRSSLPGRIMSLAQQKPIVAPFMRGSNARLKAAETGNHTAVCNHMAGM